MYLYYTDMRCTYWYIDPKITVDFKITINAVNNIMNCVIILIINQIIRPLLF